MIRRIPRVYLDTSVFGGVLDEEFQEATRALFGEIRAGRFRGVVSAVVDQELAGAPDEVRRFYLDLVPSLELLEVGSEAIELRQAYLDARVVPAAAGTDALHVAVATLAGVDLILSWNFKHMVQFERIRKFNAINLLQGLASVEIRSPLEVLRDEDEDL